MISHLGDFSLCFSGFSAVPLGNSQNPGVGVINAWHGFRVYNTAPLGKFLKGNGNYYVEGSILAGDLPSHTHAISDVTGLQTALDGKAASSHTHAISDVTNLQTTLDGKAATSHTHANTDISGLGTASTHNVPASGNAASGEVVKGNDTRLTDARTPTSHTHPQSEITNLVSDLAGKAASSHTHAAADITSGVLAMARLAAGTPDGTKFVRDDGTLAVPPNSGGTVTSFSSGNLSPLFTTSVATATTTPALSYTLATQTANIVFAGPSSGGAAVPTFRSLVAADLPVHSHSISDTSGLQAALDGKAASSHNHAASDIVSGVIAIARLATGTPDGTKFVRDDGTLATPPASSGTVTSVALTMPSIFSVSGSPVETAGTFACSLATQNANKVWAGPSSGGDATPTFRTLVSADLPSHTHAIADTTGLQSALDGKAASSHTHAAADITSGTIATARLGSGTANSSTFLRGDQTYAAPPSDSTATNAFYSTGTTDYALIDADFEDIYFGASDYLEVTLPSSGDYLVTAILELTGTGNTQTVFARFAKAGTAVSGSERRVMRHASNDEPQQIFLQNKITASGSQAVRVQAKITDDTYAIKLGYARSSISYIKLA